MRRPTTPAAPRRLLGETYVYRPGHRSVIVIDHEIAASTGRTGRLIVIPAGEPAGRPFPANAEDLE